MSSSGTTGVEALRSALEDLSKTSFSQVQAATTVAQLEQCRVDLLGKKGRLSEILKSLGSLSADLRPVIGAEANQIKAKIEALISERKELLVGQELEGQLAAERIDVTLPARRRQFGALHPITQTYRRIVEVLGTLGFRVAVGPEVETEYFCFEAVNIPADHPSRDMQDTFFLGPGVVLRTQTSAIQQRVMKSEQWPVRVLCPGAVYRCDDDATHSPMFHQLEGLWVDHSVSMSDLKGVLAYFARQMFGQETKVRLRPSYFPFVEPGAEVDVSCFKCSGKGQVSASGGRCPICRGSGWIEILGAGMVHPRLFEEAGYIGANGGSEVKSGASGIAQFNGRSYVTPGSKGYEHSSGPSGFAFGLGIDRIAMLLYQIPHLKLMFSNDSRFLRQFR